MHSALGLRRRRLEAPPGGVNEQAGERRVNAISDESSYAAGIVALPHRVRRKNHIGGPSRYGAGWQENRVPDGFITAAASVEHPRQHRHIEIGVVVDAHLALAVVEAMQPAGVLGDGSSPRDWKRQKQRVQPRIVESLSDVLASGQDDPCLIARDDCQPIGDGLPLLLAQPRPQHHEVTDARREHALETVEVIVPLREHQRRTAVVHRLHNVVADTTIAQFVNADSSALS